MAEDGERVMQEDSGSQDGKGDSRGDGMLFRFKFDTSSSFCRSIFPSHDLGVYVLLNSLQAPGASLVTATTKSYRRSR